MYTCTCRYSVENAYLEEKEDTCNALGEMAENLGPSFLPYLDDCFREVNILSEVRLHSYGKGSLVVNSCCRFLSKSCLLHLT